MARIVRCDACKKEAPFSRKSGSPAQWQAVETSDACSSQCAQAIREGERAARRSMSTPDGRAVRLTDHAISRFTERAGYVGLQVTDPIAELRLLLKAARPEKLDPVRSTKRLLSNGCAPADYYANGIWRFVVCGSDLVTVETRNHHN